MWKCYTKYKGNEKNSKSKKRKVHDSNQNISKMKQRVIEQHHSRNESGLLFHKNQSAKETGEFESHASNNSLETWSSSENEIYPIEYTNRNASNSSSEISNVKSLPHSLDSNCNFLDLNICLPTTSKWVTIATDNEVDELKENETFLETITQPHDDEPNSSCNNLSKGISIGKVDSSLQPVFIASEKVIYVHLKPIYVGDTSLTVASESHISELNSNGNEFQDVTRGVLKQDISVRHQSNLYRPSNGTDNLNYMYKHNFVPHNESTPKIRERFQHKLCDSCSRPFEFQSEVYSRNQREYIKRYFIDKRPFYSCSFVKIISQTEIIIKIYGLENLIILSKDNFIGRIQIEHESVFNFNESFQCIKSDLLNKITITKVLEDKAIDYRNECYRRFKEILQNRINKSTEDIDCAEDLLQLSNLYNYNIKWITCLDSRIILNGIIKNRCVSDVLKQSVEQILLGEKYLLNRNQCLPKFKNFATFSLNDLPMMMYQIYKSGIMNHKNNLNKYPNKFKINFMLFDKDYLPDISLLCLNGKDIKLFLDLVSFANQQNEFLDATVLQKYVMNIWNKFYRKIMQLPKLESMKELGSLTNPIYFFLFKSLCEIIIELSRVTKIHSGEFFGSADGKFSIMKTVNCTEKTPINEAFEQQYRLVFDFLEHFEPGKYSNKKSFKYVFQLMHCENKKTSKCTNNIFKTNEAENITDDRHVWLCVLDCGLAMIMIAGEENGNINKLIHSLQELFLKFLQKCELDRHESLRIVVHNVTKLAGHLCNYISTADFSENHLDQLILEKQTELVSNILVDKDNDTVIDCFPNLVDVLKEYWKNRESVIGLILSKCPCKELESIINKNILLQLLEIVNKSLDKSVAVQEVIRYFRLYNEFLQHFKEIEFEWLVSEKLFDSSCKNYVTLVDQGRKYYRVINPEQFIMTFETIKADIPEHYLITVVTELLCIISKALDKQNWCDSDQLKATGDLLLTVGHSLIYFRDQTNYVDFDNFVRNCTFPFREVLINSQTYTDFKARLDSVENFYLYTNKQKEIGIDNALNLCLMNSEASINKTFNTKIDCNKLKECYLKYSTKYFSLEKYIKISDTYSIIADMRKYVVNVSNINEWTPEFKMNVIPPVLANLAAVWTIIESKDLVKIGKRIEPHIIQILCVLRLLGVDKNNSIDKHMAQVSTGQGKSLVLGLLSALLAVTGHKSTIVCYSNYLANRDEEAFKNFFNTLNEFDVKGKVSYRTIDNAVSDCLSQNINGVEVDLADLVAKLILDELPTTIVATNRKPKSAILLIDEVDVFFSNSFCGRVLSAPVLICINALLEIQPKIWEIVEEGITDSSVVLGRIMEFINDLLKDDEYEEFKNFMVNTAVIFKKHLMSMIQSAIRIFRYKFTEDSFLNSFKIDREGMITYRNKDILYCDNCVLHGYDNVFSYFLLKKIKYEHKNYFNYGYLLVVCGEISYAELPNEFPLILGVSGTLTTLHDFEISVIKSYGINEISVMPSFFGNCKLTFDSLSDCILKDTELDWLDSIYDSVNDKIQHGRSVIVFFETEHEMCLFESKYRSKIYRLQKMTGNEEPSILEWYINESGVAQTVTLAIRSMGRGIDFKSNDLNVEQKGGMHVIQSFFSLDIKEEIQIQGRTARKDNKGSYELILCYQHLDKIDCLKSTYARKISSYRELCFVRKTWEVFQGNAIAKKIQQAAEKHELTMKFLKSFTDYTASKRMEYLSRYPMCVGIY